MRYTAFIALAVTLGASARPTLLHPRQDDAARKSGEEAIALNEKFKSLTADSSCSGSEQACIDGAFNVCSSGSFIQQSTCAAGTICAAIPNPSGDGTIVSCVTQQDLDSRIAATGATSAGDSSGGGSSGNSGNTNNNDDGGAAGNDDNGDNGDNNEGSDNGDNGGDNGGNNGNNGGDSGNGNDGGDNGGDNNGGNDGSDPQSSLTLDSRVIATGFANDGQDVPTAGQVASLTSTNNFINFCLTVPDLPITNGQQITSGSCNPAPIGVIPSTDNMPSAKFVSPKNMDNINANTAFTITMALKNLDAGNFVNAQENYFAAPQTLNDQGTIIGHTHFVIEDVGDITSTEPLDPKTFAFFKGIDTKQKKGKVSVDVTDGLPPSAYRLCSINSSSNHQPVIGPVAQHGSFDDCVYFTVS